MLSPPDVERVLQLFSKRWPHPVTHLVSQNSYTFLVAVVLSARTKDAYVNRATPALFQKASTPEAMIELGVQGIQQCIKTIGLSPQKARYIFSLSQRLLFCHGGKIPSSRKDLEALPGVGRKTANVVLSALFQRDVIAVDTHVFRVSKRLGLAKGTTPLSVEKSLTLSIPPRWRSMAHHWLIFHGRETCKAQKPLCSSCCVKHLCCFYSLNTIGPSHT